MEVDMEGNNKVGMGVDMEASNNHNNHKVDMEDKCHHNHNNNNIHNVEVCMEDFTT